MPTFPFPGMPYGPAPAWTFWLFESSSYLLFLLCLIHAARRGSRAVAYLLGGLVFGLVLEYLEVLGHSYTYGHFALMLGHPPMNIPICIGCGWAIIMYTARLFSDALGYRPLAAAALDTLLALNIDLSLDVVAYRMHLWHWHWEHSGLNPLTAQWFGIPYGNFVGWATVVFCYSAFSRSFERIGSRRRLAFDTPPSLLRTIFTALAAFVAAQAVLFTAEGWIWDFLRVHFGLTSGRRLSLIIVVLLALTLFGWRHRVHLTRPMPALARWTPTWFHAFCISCFFGLGFFRENRWMTAIACANVAVGILLHFYPAHRTSTATEFDDARQLNPELG